jgi:hypothetical protein
VPNKKGEASFYPYYPNIVARKFGIIQPLPTPFLIEGDKFLVSQRVKGL